MNEDMDSIFENAKIRLLQIEGLGISISKLTKKLNEAKDLLDKGEREDAIRVLDEFFKLANDYASKCSEFEDMRKFVEDSIDIGNKDGADMQEVSRLLEHACNLYKEDIEEAMYCIREAVEVSEDELKSLNKGVGVELEVLGAVCEKWTSGWVTIRNIGYADLDEVEITFGGACEVTGLSQIGSIPGKKHIQSPIRFLGKIKGEIPIKITVFYRNKHDGKKYSAHMMKWVSCK
jgi:tetratricopeptide (TPR) repeat protein